MLLNEFRDWLLDRNEQKAKKLDTIFNLVDIDVECDWYAVWFPGIVEIVKKVYPAILDDLIDFILDDNSLHYGANPFTASHLVEQGFIDKDRYKEYLLKKKHLKDALQFVGCRLSYALYCVDDILSALSFLLKITDRDPICKDMILEAVLNFYKKGKININDRNKIIRKLNL